MLLGLLYLQELWSLVDLTFQEVFVHSTKKTLSTILSQSVPHVENFPRINVNLLKASSKLLVKRNYKNENVQNSPMTAVSDDCQKQCSTARNKHITVQKSSEDKKLF